MSEPQASQERPTFANDRKQKELIESISDKLNELHNLLDPYTDPASEKTNQKGEDSLDHTGLSSFEQKQFETIRGLNDLDKHLRFLIQTLNL